MKDYTNNFDDEDVLGNKSTSRSMTEREAIFFVLVMVTILVFATLFTNKSWEKERMENHEQWCHKTFDRMAQKNIWWECLIYFK